MATETQADLEMNEVESTSDQHSGDDDSGSASEPTDTSSIGCVAGCYGTLAEERPPKIGKFAECDQADCNHQEYIKSVAEIKAERQPTDDRSKKPLAEVTEKL